MVDGATLNIATYGRRTPGELFVDLNDVKASLQINRDDHDLPTTIAVTHVAIPDGERGRKRAAVTVDDDDDPRVAEARRTDRRGRVRRNARVVK